MKGDCISRQAALDSLEKHWLNGMVARRIVEEIGIAINDLPSVTPAPKMGHWIKGCVGTDLERHNAKFTMYICSECGRQVIMYDSIRGEKPSDDIAYPYCHCGAKMSEIPTGSEIEG